MKKCLFQWILLATLVAMPAMAQVEDPEPIGGFTEKSSTSVEVEVRDICEWTDQDRPFSDGPCMIIDDPSPFDTLVLAVQRWAGWTRRALVGV